MSFLPYAPQRSTTWAASIGGSTAIHGAVVLGLLTSSVALLPEPTSPAVREPEYEITLEIIDADIIDLDDTPDIPEDVVAIEPEDATADLLEEDSAALTPDDDSALLTPEEDTIAPEEEALPPAEEVVEPEPEPLVEEELALLEPLSEHLPDSVLDSEPVMAPTSSPRSSTDRRNLRRASALLDEAGWAVGSDGMRRKDGQTLRIEFLIDSQTFDRVINPYVDSLRQLGVDAVHNRVDQAEAVNRERAYDFDIVTTQFPMGYIPGASLQQSFGSETADISTRNLMGLKSPAVDALIDHITAATSQDAL